MTDGVQRVAIVGGGFSGAMLAARLAEAGVASTVVDRTGDFGRGVAYSTPFAGHRLNVRSGRMSALANRPDDFVRWLEVQAPEHADPDGFAPRGLYGDYVQARLRGAQAAWPGRIETLAGEVAAVEGAALRLADGRRIEADAVVLATGNPAPKAAARADEGASGRIVLDPWAVGALARVGAEDTVILLGAGLTMVDMVLSLLAQGWKGRATALSRRGLTPRAHGAGHDAPIPPTPALTAGPASARLAEGRRLADGGAWRGVMEGLRPVTAELWARADSATRARLLRHLRPWWDVHRHRIPADIAATLEALKADGRLRVVAGRARRIAPAAGGLRLDWAPRGGAQVETLAGDWLIDCTGPGHDAATNPLTASLIAAGRARLHETGLGLGLDPDGRVVTADGAPSPSLFALGPPARAAFWETVAVPDIRQRIEALTALLAAAQARASR